LRLFYNNFRSARYMRDDPVLRLHRQPSDGALGQMGTTEIHKPGGGFRLSESLAVEKDEPALAHLHRLVFPFNRRDHRRLRMLIDFLNNLP
jgi:hypothetical protein